MSIINRTTRILEQSGRRKKVEVSVKRRFIRDWNTREWTEIQRTPADGRLFWQYRFEITQHDLHLAFAPRSKDLPFLLIKDPHSGGYWVLWFVGWDDFTPTNPIQPQIIDRGGGYVEFRLDETTRLRFEILGHLIRKLIIVEKRPVWNRLKFRISRANAILLDGARLGVPHKKLIAFPKDATFADNPIFWFSEPRAWYGQPSEPRRLTVNYDVQPITNAIWDLTISLDADELDNAEYPVFVDPTVVLQPDAAEGYDNYFAIDAATNVNNGARSFLAFTYRRGYSVFNVAQTLIKFDLSSIPSGALINSADLKLTKLAGIFQSTAHDIPVYTFRLLKDWKEGNGVGSATQDGESDENYYDKPNPWDAYCANSEGGDYVDDGDSPYIWNDIPATLTLHLPKTIQAIIDSGVNYGFKITTINEDGYDTGTGPTYYLPYSSDDSNITWHPKLTIDYTEGGIFIPAKPGALAGKGVLSSLANA